MGQLQSPTDDKFAYSRGVVLVLIGVVAHVVLYLDLAVQRIATTTRLSRLAPPKLRTPDGTRFFNRALIGVLAVFLTIFTLGFEYEKVTRHVEVPILGYGESSVFGYYPPIGSEHFPIVPAYNVPPKYRPRTPLLIPFTRNNTMIKQTVLSYIAGGWPRADILLVDNSGTMDANSRGQLSPSNPFYLNYDLFRKRYGVSIIQTPTLLTFAQLQNFMLRVALGRGWPYYFWTHMDVAVLSAEDVRPYKSFYHRILDVLDSSGVDQWSIKPAEEGETGGRSSEVGIPSKSRSAVFAGPIDRSSSSKPEYQAKSKRGLIKKPWGVKFFAYDYLTLVNVPAWKETGQWDNFIPYYNTDCDFYQRMAWAGYSVEEAQAGHVYDVADVIADPEQRFFPGLSQKSRNQWGTDLQAEERAGGQINSGRFKWLKAELQAMMDRKLKNKDGRNTWQAGGLDNRGKPGWDGKPVREKLDPWTYDPRGFQAAWWVAADAGRAMYIKKWGTLDCDLKGAKKSMNDMWLLQYIQKGSELYNVRASSEEHYQSMLKEDPIR